MRRVLAAQLALLSYVACNTDDAALASFDTQGRNADAARSSGSGAADSDAESDAASSSGSTSSSGSSSSSSGEVDAGLPDADVEPGLCRVEYTYGFAQPVAGLESLAGEVAFSVTPNERFIAWLDADSDPDAGGRLVHVAGRASESVAFEAPVAITVSDAAYPGKHGLAFSNDGLHLVLTSLDETKLGELTRSSTDVDFDGTIDTAPFAAVEPDADADASPVGWPVLGYQDRLLALSRARPIAPTVPVLVSDRALPTDAWPLPSPRTELVLTSNPDRKRVTGVSYDGLTFFVRNDATNEMFAVNRPNDGGTFEPEYARALAPASDNVSAILPNAACDRLYVLQSGGTLAVRRKLEE